MVSGGNVAMKGVRREGREGGLGWKANRL